VNGVPTASTFGAGRIATFTGPASFSAAQHQALQQFKHQHHPQQQQQVTYNHMLPTSTIQPDPINVMLLENEYEKRISYRMQLRLTNLEGTHVLIRATAISLLDTALLTRHFDSKPIAYHG